ncbi:MAG: ABC transporter ATP-binding protein [Proteobacteria bacterium]|nr:ABC transporter ATP-binding protein [Pseudomonadota bacterium]
MELRARGLELARGGRVLLRDLDLELRRGECWVALGPNGAGKSTLLLALGGWLPRPAPSRGDAELAGELRLDGRPPRSWSSRERARRVAWQGSLPPAEFGLSVRERLGLALERGVDRSRVESAAARLDLEGLEDRRLGELSAGERQRVELAALVLREAPLWLLDEPTAHLDLRHQVSWLREMAAERDAGRCLVMACHDLGQARALADGAILLFGDGRARAGPASELLVAPLLSELYATPLEIFEAGGPGLPPLLAPAYARDAADGGSADE